MTVEELVDGRVVGHLVDLLVERVEHEPVGVRRPRPAGTGRSIAAAPNEFGHCTAPCGTWPSSIDPIAGSKFRHDPVEETVGVVVGHHQRQLDGAVGDAGPAQRRGDVVAVARVEHRDLGAVLPWRHHRERWTGTVVAVASTGDTESIVGAIVDVGGGNTGGDISRPSFVSQAAINEVAPSRARATNGGRDVPEGPTHRRGAYR